MALRARKKKAEWWMELESNGSSAEVAGAQSGACDASDGDKSTNDADNDEETALARQTLVSMRKGTMDMQKKKKGKQKKKKELDQHVDEPTDGGSSGPDTGESGESPGSCSDRDCSGEENECSESRGDCGSNAPKVFTGRKKRRTRMLPEELRAAERQANAKGITVQLPRFGEYIFPSFSAFVCALEKHSENHWVMTRFNHTLRRDAGNKRIRTAYMKRMLKARSKGAPFTEKLRLIPKSFSHFEMTAKCVHGCTQSARGHGKRYPAATRYTGCTATIHAKVVLDPETDQWRVEVDNEIPIHNHSLGPDIYDSYLTSSEIEDDTLFNEVAGMVEAEGNPRIICDMISRRLNRHYTGQNLSNFRNHRLGGADAREGMKLLLKKFSSFDGSRLLVVQDQEGLTTGLALQTGFQRAMMQRYGDSLLLDWTHNTNNCGFYLGSLMVTTVNGTGFSVLDFLCVTQSKDMMRTIFRQFVEWEPSVLDKIKSVVIDKDYNEWAVLEELFPNADIVLCQFHVSKWFKHVVNLAKYNIPVALRDDVVAVLKAQIYAVDDEDFSHQQTRLSELLSSTEHQQFLVYMKDRWYSCVKMWSYASRGKIFTATNTTTNRLEAFWRQYKEALGDKQRIDLCVEAIFLHATSVLRREKKFMTDFVGKTRLQPNLDPFLRPVFADLSEYAAGLVGAQFNKYKSSASVGESNSILQSHVLDPTAAAF